jgi:hypothetical protein
VEEERVSAVRADVPLAAFKMSMYESGIKEHICNILTEAGYETVGELMFTLKTNPNKVLGLAGIGAKAIQNVEEALAALTFPEPEAQPEPGEPVKVEEPVAVAAVETAPAATEATETAPAAAPAEPVAAAETPAPKKSAEGKKEAKKVVEEEDTENAKDGVVLDELFKIKPEIFQTPASEDDDSLDKNKKGKKGKKKSVELEFDESLGTVVGRKIHKRGDEEETWE